MYPSPEWAAEVDRRLNQQGDDIMSLYDVSERIEGKVDRLAERMDARFEQVDARFEQVDARFEQVDARFEQVDGRFDGLSAEVAGQRVLLERILERLDRD